MHWHFVCVVLVKDAQRERAVSKRSPLPLIDGKLVVNDNPSVLVTSASEDDSSLCTLSQNPVAAQNRVAPLVPAVTRT